MWVSAASASVTVTFGNLTAGVSTGLSFYANGTTFLESVSPAQAGAIPVSNIIFSGIDVTNPASQLTGPLFCIEIPEGISSIPGTTVFNGSAGPDGNDGRGLVPLANAPERNGLNAASVTPMGAVAAGLISELWTHAFTNSMTPTENSAFQLAIWKLEYDQGSTDWTTGYLRTDAITAAGAVVTLATQWINDVNNNVYAPTDLVALTDWDKQDFVGQGVAYESTPEPASLIVWSVLSASVAGMALIRRRRGGAARWSAENRQAILKMIENK